MSPYYRCTQHGRFPITAAFTELVDPKDIFAKATELAEVPCPKCGTPCPRCRGCSDQTVTLAAQEPVASVLPTKSGMSAWNWDLWFRSLPEHCPDCQPGVVCQSCGKDYSNVI